MQARTELTAGAIAELQADLVRIVAELETIDIRRARYQAEAEARDFVAADLNVSSTSSGNFLARMRDLEQKDYNFARANFERDLQTMSESLAVLAEEKSAIEDQQVALTRVVELFDEEARSAQDLVNRGLGLRAQSMATLPPPRTVTPGSRPRWGRGSGWCTGG